MLSLTVSLKTKERERAVKRQSTTMEINLEERLHSEQLWLVWTDGAWGGLMDVMVVMDEQRGGPFSAAPVIMV